MDNFELIKGAKMVREKTSRRVAKIASGSYEKRELSNPRKLLQLSRWRSMSQNENRAKRKVEEMIEKGGDSKWQKLKKVRKLLRFIRMPES